MIKIVSFYEIISATLNIKFYWFGKRIKFVDGNVVKLLWFRESFKNVSIFNQWFNLEKRQI